MADLDLSTRPVYPVGIHDIPDADYFGAEGASKSFLDRMYNRSPAHAKAGFDSKTPAMEIGSATHCAILEPHDFDKRYVCGPDDRRGNKWKDAVAAAEAQGMTCLTKPEFETVLRIRDAVHANSEINRLVQGNDAQVEHAAFWTESGTLCKSKVDLYRPGLKTIIDLKTTVSARADAFAKSVANYNYHFQDAMYSRGWKKAGGGDVEDFVFLAVEKDPPYAAALYRLTDEARKEGLEMFRQSLRLYRQCVENDHWPGYPTETQTIDLPRWAYRLTTENF